MVRRLPLTYGYFALVDEADWPLVSQYTWYAKMYGKRIYASAAGPGKKELKLHRVIMAAPKGMFVDHINGQPLDCRRENLRVCSRTDNARAFRAKKAGATSKARGVYFHSKAKKWYGQLSFSKSFDTEAEAVAWRNELASRFHGEFAQLNTLDGAAPASPPIEDFRNIDMSTTPLKEAA